MGRFEGYVNIRMVGQGYGGRYGMEKGMDESEMLFGEPENVVL